MDTTTKTQIIKGVVATMCIMSIMLVYGVITGAREGNEYMVESCTDVLIGIGVFVFMVLCGLGFGWMIKSAV